MSGTTDERVRILRGREWAHPVRPARREVLSARPRGGQGRPPLLFVPGFGHGAWAFAEHWLEHTASRGFPAYAVSLRGHGGSEPAPGATLRAYTHDVVQVAAGLPQQAVLVGHGAGALVVAHALARYPARAAVLVAPVLGGSGDVRRGAARQPGRHAARPVRRARCGCTAGSCSAGSCPTPRPGGTLAPAGPGRPARPVAAAAGRAAEPAVGDPPVLVLGSPDDRVVPPAALTRAARRYGAAPLLFPGMGHDLMLDARWREPIDAILDWLDKEPAPRRP